MSRRSLFPLAAAAAIVMFSLAAAPVASGASASTGVSHRNVHVCAAPTAGMAACDAILHETISPSGRPVTSSTVSGYGPSNLQTAYNLPSATAGAGQTVAIVDAYNDPNAASDVATYRTYFGLPACTTSTGCLRIVNQSGGTKLPRNNGGWAQEISLDLDMVSAICPNCKILLVEASTNSLSNLGTAVNTAASLGATEISNSYGGSESSSDTTYDTSYYDHPGIAVTASTGDNGYGVEYPSASPYVTAAGGTTLNDNGGVYSQTAWSGSGSGCSAYDPQPSWQSAVSNITTTCSKRAVADVSADANPNTGVAVYDSYSYQGLSGWLVFGGTSVASPILASTYALAGNAATAGQGASYVYAHDTSTNITDITSGSTGSCGTDLCNAGPGWDGPTGLGTPNGVGGF
ncbi:MAG: S53 family peptidase [Acidimicrobiales bacterium]